MDLDGPGQSYDRSIFTILGVTRPAGKSFGSWMIRSALGLRGVHEMDPLHSAWCRPYIRYT